MATEVMVEGADELARALRKMTDEMRASVLAGALAPAALPVLRAAQAYAPSAPTPPNAPDDLKSGLAIKWGKQGARVGADADHADVVIGSFGRRGKRDPQKSYQFGYLEFGSAHNRAHPYLRPALDSTKDQVVAKITHWLRYLMSTVGPAT